MNDTDNTTQKKSRKSMIIIISIVIGIGCIIGLGGVTLFVSPFNALQGDDTLDAFGPDGAYTIGEVVLTNEVDEQGKPIGSADVFRPYEKIIGWVSTEGADGIIGMRWYYEDQLIFEHFDKTQDHQIFTFIQSNAAITLPEGNYRLDIHITETPRQSLEFKVQDLRKRHFDRRMFELLRKIII